MTGFRNDLTGRRFGEWIVIYPIHGSRKGRSKLSYWCQCGCGREQKICASNLLSGATTKCVNCYHLSHRKRPFEAAYNRYRRTVLSVGDWHFDLSYADYLELTADSECHYCGRELFWKPYHAKNERYGHNLDRKDNTRGYTKDNVVVCCKICNQAKSNIFTYTEFLSVGLAIRGVRYQREGVFSSSWIETYSGVQFFPLSPRPSDVRVEDIAHGLSLSPRFAGHTREFMSVAQHSVHVADVLAERHPDRPRLQLHGLLHDAPESYACDFPKPIKDALPQYSGIENKLLSAIYAGLNILPPSEEECAIVKQVDRLMLVTERRDLFVKPIPPAEWLIKEEPWYYEIVPWHPVIAEGAFKNRYYKLVREVEATR